MVNMARMPPCSGPTSSPSASSKRMTQVGLPWMPSLCSIRSQRTELRRPAVPSGPTMRSGTRKRDSPRVPAGAPVVRARTRWTMFPVRSCSPHVMKTLVPDTRHRPSSPLAARSGWHRGQNRLGLGEVHRPGPLPGHQAGEVGGLLGLVAPLEEGVDGALGEHRVEGQRRVRRGEHLLECEGDDRREPRPPPRNDGRRWRTPGASRSDGARRRSGRPPRRRPGRWVR